MSYATHMTNAAGQSLIAFGCDIRLVEIIANIRTDATHIDLEPDPALECWYLEMQLSDGTPIAYRMECGSDDTHFNFVSQWDPFGHNAGDHTIVFSFPDFFIAERETRNNLAMG